jgi:signal transduction histidine kinase
LSVYRIVQEALTNTMRHAGASRARVAICYDAPAVRVRVTDDGAGNAPGSGDQDGRRGHGIGGMRERAALHDGSLMAGPAPGGGWAVVAELRPGAGTAAR